MASSSRDVTMAEHRILEDSKRSMDKEAAENFRSRLTHQWFDPSKTFPSCVEDALLTQVTQSDTPILSPGAPRSLHPRRLV